MMELCDIELLKQPAWTNPGDAPAVTEVQPFVVASSRDGRFCILFTFQSNVYNIFYTITQVYRMGPNRYDLL